MNKSYEEYRIESLAEVLKTNIVEISFTKNDGTERKIRATLKSDMLPEVNESTATKPTSPDIQVVWSVDDQGWRAFRKDSLISATIV